MRISDWSSDVCSSDLSPTAGRRNPRSSASYTDAPPNGTPKPRHARASGCLSMSSSPDLARSLIFVDKDRCSDMPCKSEEHTSVLQSLMRNSYAVFCLKIKPQRHDKICIVLQRPST